MNIKRNGRGYYFPSLIAVSVVTLGLMGAALPLQAALVVSETTMAGQNFVSQSHVVTKKYKKVVPASKFSKERPRKSPKGQSAKGSTVAGIAASVGCLPENPESCGQIEVEVTVFEFSYIDMFDNAIDFAVVEIESMPLVETNGFRTCLVTISNGNGEEADIPCEDLESTYLGGIGISDSYRDDINDQVVALVAKYLGKKQSSLKKGNDKASYFLGANSILLAAYAEARAGDTAKVQYADGGCVLFEYNPLTLGTKWNATDENASCGSS